MLTAEDAKRIFSYNKKTGELRWEVKTSNKVTPGTTAGKLFNNGKKDYLRVGVNKMRLYVHRVIFLIVTGTFPTNEVDHINGDGTDNRWKNIRPATRLENLKNRRIPSNNSSGNIGVFWSKGGKCWTAQIGYNGKAHHLGYFTHLSDAIRAREEAQKQRGFHKNHGSKRPL